MPDSLLQAGACVVDGADAGDAARGQPGPVCGGAGGTVGALSLDCTATSTSLPAFFLAQFSALCHHTRAVERAQLCDRAYQVLIGACNPMRAQFTSSGQPRDHRDELRLGVAHPRARLPRDLPVSDLLAPRLRHPVPTTPRTMTSTSI